LCTTSLVQPFTLNVTGGAGGAVGASGGTNSVTAGGSGNDGTSIIISI